MHLKMQSHTMAWRWEGALDKHEHLGHMDQGMPASQQKEESSVQCCKSPKFQNDNFRTGISLLVLGSSCFMGC